MAGIDDMIGRLREIIETKKDIEECKRKLEEVGDRIANYVMDRLGDYLGEYLTISSQVKARKLKILGEDREVSSVRIDVGEMRDVTISFDGYKITLGCITLSGVIFLLDNLDAIIDILNEVLENERKELRFLNDKLKEATHKMSELMV